MFGIIKKGYFFIRQSIAFYPILIMTSFIVLSILALLLEYSAWGQQFKEHYPFLIVGDAVTARTILGTLIGGIISITVFSFSMVMIVMNQAASYYSQKLSHRYVEEKPSQIVLGFYVGSIIFCLVLLFRISDYESVLNIPSLGILMATLFGIGSILMFIYFINYISKSIELFNVVTNIHQKTAAELKKLAETSTEISRNREEVRRLVDGHQWHTYESDRSGYFQDVQEEKLIKLAAKKDLIFKMDVVFGTYLVKGTPLFSATQKIDLNTEDWKNLYAAFGFYVGEKIGENLFYGFRQLSEIAVKALSSGINDPATAIFCIDHLKDLYALKMQKSRNDLFLGDDGKVRLITRPVSFDELFYMVISPLRFYGKADVLVMASLLELLKVLAYLDREQKLYKNTLNKHLKMIILDAGRSITNKTDRDVLKNAVYELMSVHGYFYLNAAEIRDL